MASFVSCFQAGARVVAGGSLAKVATECSLYRPGMMRNQEMD